MDDEIQTVSLLEYELTRHEHARTLKRLIACWSASVALLATLLVLALA